MSLGNITQKPNRDGWESRMVVEYKELSERLEKLDQYLTDCLLTESLNEFEQESVKLLIKQRDAMIAYKEALEARFKHHCIVVD